MVELVNHLGFVERQTVKRRFCMEQMAITSHVEQAL
jgi:hypothetical protein